MLELVRSPAKVTWQVKCNGQAIITEARRYEAIAKGQALAKKMGLEFRA